MPANGRLPGMGGSASRRTIVAALYVVGWPLLFVLLPVLLGAVVWRNYAGWASLLAFAPGIAPEGGVRSGLVAVGYGLLVWLLAALAFALILVP